MGQVKSFYGTVHHYYDLPTEQAGHYITACGKGSYVGSTTWTPTEEETNCQQCLRVREKQRREQEQDND